MANPRHLVYAVKFVAEDGKPDLISFTDRESAEAAKARIKGATLSLHMVGEVVPEKPLTEAQERFLLNLAVDGISHSPWGMRDSGRHASAWYRTVRALRQRGLVAGRCSGTEALFTLKGLVVVADLLDKQASAR